MNKEEKKSENKHFEYQFAATGGATELCECVCVSVFGGDCSCMSQWLMGLESDT